MTSPRSVQRHVLAEIIQRIVRVADPQRIIMFGSAAAGRMGPHSDIDLLVISDHDEDRGQILGDIYVALHGVGQAVDIVMVTPEEVEQFRDVPSMVIHPALEHGIQISSRQGTS